MDHAAQVDLARRLLRRVKNSGDSPTASEPRTTYISRARYVSQDFFEAERRALFATTPQIVAHVSDLAEPGACLTVDVAGVSLLLTRDGEDRVHAFRNACRHRSTQLVSSSEPCRKKAIVCPYHGWTYDLTGRRIHVPHLPMFAGEDRDRDALTPAFAEVRHGLVWASLAPFDAREHLGELDEEMASIELPSWKVHQRSQHAVAGNWKLVVDAFLDGYHIRHLHRDTVYRFFFDGQSDAERVGRHIRAATARRTLADATEKDLARSDGLRALVTPSYIVFPNTVLILHPDYTSVIRLEPLAANRTRFSHTMLVPQTTTEDQREHFDKSFSLIDEGVFLREDLAIVEAMQRGMEASTDESLLFGELEFAAKWFHESVDAAVRSAQ
jgi:phenylpropionate dioxygenase-like ring-hydroxylating dioxygenase large terminal subunit